MAEGGAPSYPLVGKLIAGGGALGVLLSLASHSFADLLKVAGPLGTLIALVFGALYGGQARQRFAGSAAGGALTGAGCGGLGILAGWLLGDQAAFVLAAGTVGSAVAGALGGLVGRALRGGAA